MPSDSLPWARSEIALRDRLDEVRRRGDRWRNPATRRLAALAGFDADDVVLLAGSTQEPEEAVVLEVFRRLQPSWPKLRLVLVPRHPDRFETTARLLDAAGVAWQRRSELERTGPNPAARVMLVDAVGELGAWWGTAQVAFAQPARHRALAAHRLERAPEGRSVRERHAALNRHEVEDDGLGDEPALPGLGPVERRDNEERGRGADLAKLVDEAVQGELVLLAVELPQVALVRSVLKHDERRIAQRERVSPVVPILPLPVDGHRGVRPERVVDDAGSLALEGHPEEARWTAARGAHSQSGLPVGDSRRVDARDLGFSPRREALREPSTHRDLDVAAAWLLEIVDIEA